MKKIFHYCFVVFLGLTGCVKEEIEAPNSAEVVVEKSVVKVGEPVQFKFTNTSDVITFYSGEATKKYSNIDKISVDASLMVSFDSKGEWEGYGGHMSLIYSKDFVGIDSLYSNNTLLSNYEKQVTDSLSIDSLGLDEEVIDFKLDSLREIFVEDKGILTDKELFDKATWEKIEGVTFGENWVEKHADVDLSALSGKKVTLAFKRANNVNHGNYYIYNYRVMAVSDELGSPMPYIDLGAGFYPYTPGDVTSFGYWFLNGSRMQSNAGNPWWSSGPMEHYLLMAALNLDEENFPVEGSRGTTIKGYVDKLEEYEYAYSEPGVYEATFIFINRGDNGNDAKEVVRTVEIIVEE